MEEHNIKGNKFKVDSICRLHTSVIEYEKKIALDVGRKPMGPFDVIFISHTHLDHSQEIKKFKKKGGVKVYIPKGSKIYFEKLLNSLNELNYLKECESNHNFDFKEVGQGDVIEYKDMIVKVIELDHTVPTNGYLFYEKRKKIKEEYKNKSSEELTALSKKKVTLKEDVLHAKFCYIFDTSIKAFEENDFSKFDVILSECTFLDKEDYERAHDKSVKHIHIFDLEKYFIKYNKSTFILSHFSKRYDKKYMHGIKENYMNDLKKKYMDVLGEKYEGCADVIFSCSFSDEE